MVRLDSDAPGTKDLSTTTSLAGQSKESLLHSCDNQKDTSKRGLPPRAFSFGGSSAKCGAEQDNNYGSTECLAMKNKACRLTRTHSFGGAPNLQKPVAFQRSISLLGPPRTTKKLKDTSPEENTSPVADVSEEMVVMDDTAVLFDREVSAFEVCFQHQAVTSKTKLKTACATRLRRTDSSQPTLSSYLIVGDTRRLIAEEANPLTFRRVLVPSN